jgi:integrase/recombinase XerD
MTQLRQKMLEELQRRDYSHRTAKTYIRIVRDFAAYFHRSPDKLGLETHPPIPGLSVSKQKVVDG